MKPTDLLNDILALTMRVHVLEHRLRCCRECSAPPSRYSKSGLCRSCSARRNATAPARAKAAAWAAMTPFERQMEAVRRGAGIVEVRPIPTRTYPYTLGGVSAL